MMADNEKTSSKIAKIASKAMKAPSTLTNDEIKSLGASALTQAPDKPKPKAKAKPKKKP
jgi:carnitine O-acetyltransferase